MYSARCKTYVGAHQQCKVFINAKLLVQQSGFYNLPSSDCDDHYYLPSHDDIITGGPWLASPALELTVLDRTSQVATLTSDHWLQHSFGVLFCIVLFLTIDYSILLQDEFFFQGCTPEWISTLIGFVATRRCGRRCHRKKCKKCY